MLETVIRAAREFALPPARDPREAEEEATRRRLEGYDLRNRRVGYVRLRLNDLWLNPPRTEGRGRRTDEAILAAAREVDPAWPDHVGVSLGSNFAADVDELAKAVHDRLAAAGRAYLVEPPAPRHVRAWERP
jgi:hypothetical protein